MMAGQGSVTLLTDFGTRDGYVGAMKGVILARHPQAAIVDITHDVAPQDVLGGALSLRTAAPWYPPGTIHVAVVDPGVGSGRAALLLDDGQALYLGPDNGLLSLAVPRPRAAYRLDRERWFRLPVSATFHGRDVFASVAGHLAAGVAPSELATPVDEFVRLSLPEPRSTAAGCEGEVIHCDRFGNLVTNVTRAELAALGGGSGLEIAGAAIARISTTYADVSPGELVVLVGSSGFLEVAVRDGSARRSLSLEHPVGTRVTLSRARGRAR